MISIDIVPHSQNTPTVIEELFTDTYFEVLVDNVYLDFTDLNQFIKNYIKSEIIRFVNKDFTSGLRVYLRKNYYNIRDSIWPSFWNDEKVGEFSSIERVENFVQNKYAKSIFRIEIYIDPQVDNYSARIINILDITGTIGGVFELLKITIGFVIGIYSSKSLNRSIENRLKEMEK